MTSQPDRPQIADDISDNYEKIGREIVGIAVRKAMEGGLQVGQKDVNIPVRIGFRKNRTRPEGPAALPRGGDTREYELEWGVCCFGCDPFDWGECCD